MSPAESVYVASSGADPDNIPASSLEGDASPSNPNVLRTLYSVLLKTRLLEEQVLALSRAGKLPGSVVPILGGEATEVGGCIGLRPGDSFSSSQPKLATDVVLGKPLEHIFARLVQRNQQSAPGDSSSFHVAPHSSSLTGQLDIAAGIALAYRQLGRQNVVVAVADDGLAALGFWHEAAHLASRHRLPIVFMVENCEQSHPQRPSTVQSNEDLRDRAEAYGIPGITVDGNDIVAVWRVTQESIHRARSGAGPTLIECRTWRWHAETVGAPSNGDRTHGQNDPLRHMEHYMKKRSLWSEKWKDELAASYRKALVAATKSAERTANGRKS